jgi:uncharacterized protein involved in exopolysaccharide biosynthesis
MNHNLLKSRIIRIISTPQELFFAITRHWAILSICIAAGVLIMWKKEVSGVRIYEGRAQLLVNPQETFVVAENRAGQGRSDDDTLRFLVSQTSILQSDSVLQKLIEMLGPASLTPSDAQEDVISQLKQKFSEFFFEDTRPDGVQGPENETQMAIKRFRERSLVKPDMNGNTIKLLVYGADRELIRNELKSWINAYIKHVEEISRENLESFLSERILFYKQNEGSALREFEAFKTANPEVNASNQDFYSQEIIRLQIHQGDIRRQIAFGVSAVPTFAPAVSEADGAALKKAESDLIDYIAKGFGEDSVPVIETRNKIKLLRAQKSTVLGPKVDEDDGQRLEKSLAATNKELEDLLKKSSELKEKLKLRQDLEESYRQARDKRTKYELMNQESKDNIESRKIVQIQVADKPMVSAEPFEYHPVRKLFLGFLAGAVAGVIAALCIEIFSVKIRFVTDVVRDVGLNVVAVVPKR